MFCVLYLRKQKYKNTKKIVLKDECLIPDLLPSPGEPGAWVATACLERV